jgi:predicted transcriptional regulator
VNGENKPTRIIYGSNISWNTLNQIIDSLIEQGFLERKKVKKTYRYEITEKGIRSLSYFRKAVQEIMFQKTASLLI